MKSECDIILLSYERPDLLRACVDSILERTGVRSTLIIVDNGSKDPGVIQYLNGIRGNHTVDIEKVLCEENAGFAAGMNKGMRLSDAPFMCLLNNDCVVTEGWLEEMMSVARSMGNIGLVNPQSSTFGSFPDTGVSANEHAGLLSDKKGGYVELGHAIGFACLIKREVVDKTGYLDEVYEGVCYEDTDFSVRAQKEGYMPVMAEGAYVFHAGQASRKSLKGREQVYSRNRSIFESKWGRLLRVLYWDRSRDIRGDRDAITADYEALKGLARQRAIVEVWAMDREKIVHPGSERNFMVRLTSFAHHKSTGNDISCLGQRITTDVNPWRFIDTVKHADISVRFFSSGLVNLSLLWRVLTKKKGYDAVILGKGPLLHFLRLLGRLRGTRVFSLEEGMRAVSGKGAVFDLKAPSALAEYLRKR